MKFKKKYKCLCLIMLCLCGCATSSVYQATPEDTHDLSLAQARALLIESAQATAWCKDRGTAVITHTKIKVTCQGSTTKISLKFDGNPSVIGANIYGNECVQKISDKGTPTCAFYWVGAPARTHARNFARAWSVFAREAPVLRQEYEIAFEKTAQSYLNSQVKPQLPEEAIRYKVQAEGAVREKRFDDASDLFNYALEIAPWWPAGHYNRGLILAEQKDYKEAIIELKRYLKLEPNAANSRAVQLKIYELEGLVSL
ncbi:MAG: hypothetical protein A2X86_08140 [Bdellovibrionales bacterium GWA2_49_15]|nr:MAG: hypothetical protein A2X86_08140 [Bdellovibrionales bacterium GWA2_49_15]HAZ13923.1 hypothetical protein [Bdellovibrionales bacterium]